MFHDVVSKTKFHSQFKPHAVVYLIVLKCNVVFIYGIPVEFGELVHVQAWVLELKMSKVSDPCHGVPSISPSLGAETRKTVGLNHTTHHFWIFSFSGRVPSWAAANFFKSPMVSSSLHFTRIFLPNLSFSTTSIMIACVVSDVGFCLASQQATFDRARLVWLRKGRKWYPLPFVFGCPLLCKA